MTHFSPEDILRRELHAAAESFEPVGDGLAQIRALLGAPRPLAIAWLMVSWTTVIQPALLRVDEAFVALGERLGPILRPVASALHVTAERLHPVAVRLYPVLRKLRTVFTPRTEPSGRPSRYAWLRPALAMAAVVLVAIAGGFALSGLPRQIQQAANSILSNPAHGTKTGHNSGLTGSGQPIPSPTSGRHGASPTPAPSCTPSPTTSKAPKVTPSPTPSQSSPSPTPSASTTSPTPTPTAPTPSPSDTGGGLSSTPPSANTGAVETSVVTFAKPAHPGSVTKGRPTPKPTPTCTSSSG
jgi:hypothetical protein